AWSRARARPQPWPPRQTGRPRPLSCLAGACKRRSGCPPVRGGPTMAGPMRQLAAGLMLLALACERPPARSRTGNDGAAPDVMGDAGDAPDTADFDAPSADTADAADTGGTADATADATDAADATADATDAADASSDAADAADADPGDADVDVPPNVSACGRATRPLQSLTVVPEIIKQIPSAYSLR